jgi:hypothetical protein
MLTFGGYADGTGNNLVTMFNWMTLEMCSLPTLPYIVSGLSTTTGFGLPMFCGGGIPGAGRNRDTCYKFNPITKGWTQVSIFFFFFINTLS